MLDSSLLLLASEGGSANNAISTLYTAVSAVLVAGFSLFGVWLNIRFGKKRHSEDEDEGDDEGDDEDVPRHQQHRVARHYEALKVFVIYRGYDPRKIRTGYEPPEEVLHAAE